MPHTRPITTGKHDFKDISIEVEDTKEYTLIKVQVGSRKVEFFYNLDGSYDGAGMYTNSKDDDI